MGINGVAKLGLSHVMRLKTNFGLRKPFSHLGISVLRKKERAKACGERILVIFLQVTKSLRDQEEKECLVLKNQKIKGMETKRQLYFSCVGLMKTPNFFDESVCIGCKQVLEVTISCVWLF